MRRFTTTMIAAVLLLAVGGSTSAATEVSCGKIIAAMDEADGGESADEMAAQLGTTVDRIRECMKTPAANPPGNPPGGSAADPSGGAGTATPK